VQSIEGALPLELDRRGGTREPRILLGDAIANNWKPYYC
jgi:hypothetical protein